LGAARTNPYCRVGVLGVCAAVLAATGCHNGTASGRPTDGGMEVKPDLTEKLPPPDVYCAPDAAGGGSCPINYCGHPKSVKALATGESAELGTERDTCTPGYICVPDVATPDGKALDLRCVLPTNTPSVAQGMPCTKGTGDMRCKSDALCIESPDFAGMPFCSALCRADADCAAGNYCLEYDSAKLPNDSVVRLGYCTPPSRIAGKVCAKESDCGATEGCVPYGGTTGRTALQVCKPGGTKATGEKCTADADCRSKLCFDREFQVPATGKRTFCTANCRKNSDCAPDQQCARIVLNNNGTPADPRDDVVTGYCRSLFTPTEAMGCKNDSECTAKGGTTCDKTHGLCYTAGAKPGATCTTPENCELGATCPTSDDGYPGGYCLSHGCAPGAATGVDSCGANGVCAQRGTDAPLNACYEGCATSACSRAAESYVCKPATSAPGATGTICLFDRGV
jgi:hypothetical protein